MMKLRIKNIPKTTIILAIVCAIALILFVGAYAKKDAFSQVNLLGERTTTVESQVKDSDNDGLKDWEENLYKTDYLNPDTDGDGYLDGEEISSGHNPLIKAPGDNQVFYPLPLGDKYNITNKLLGDFTAVAKAYIAQKDQYVQEHPEIQSQDEYLAQTSQSTLSEMFKRALLYNENDWLTQAQTILQQLPEMFDIEITDENITISDDNSPDAIRAYAEKLINYFDSQDFFLKEGNLLLLKDILSQENNFSQLDGIIETNNQSIENLVSATVPSSWKEIHKKTLKIAITMRNIFISVRGYETDPIKTLVATNKLKDVSSLWTTLGQEITNLNKLQNLNLPL